LIDVPKTTEDLLFAEKRPPSNTPKLNTCAKKARVTLYEDDMDLDDTASGGKRKNCSKRKASSSIKRQAY